MDPVLPPPDTGDVAAAVDRTEHALFTGHLFIGQVEAQHRNDAALIEAVLSEGLGGDRQERLETELIKYSIPVLTRLITHGTISERCRLLGWPITASGDRLSRLRGDVLEDLVIDMVAAGLPVFRQWVFKDRSWSSEGGAALTTCFVNACIRQFPTQFRRWDKRQHREVLGGLDLAITSPASSSGPEDQALTQVETRKCLDAVTDEQTRELLVLAAAGYTRSEAAARVGLTVKAAEGRIARVRKRLRGSSTDPPVRNDDRPGDTGRRAQA